jgi:predicted ATPase/DNA-binding CsgD family transcriptional regulator
MLLENFPDGIYFVPLAPLHDPDLVIPTIARAFGLNEAGELPLLEHIQMYVQNKCLLLLLDNIEQVISSSPLLLTLLAGCPHMKILVTSREALRVRCEHTFSVLPFTLPDPGLLADPGILAKDQAIQLFLQHAQAVNPAFQLTSSNISTLAEICIHLDGLPLAIELAAIHMKLLTPQQLLAHLKRRLPVLIGGKRDVAERQQTLRNTIKWSYDLLTTHEQQVFRRFAAFSGGTLEALEAVCASVDGMAVNVLSCVMGLLDKHLIQRATYEDGESRLLMLGTIQEFALECLEGTGEMGVTQRAHVEYYVEMAEKVEPKLRQEQQVLWLERLTQEHNNVRAALHWLMEREDNEKMLRLCASLWRFWLLRGHLKEGWRWLERALVYKSEKATAARARALEGAGRIAIFQSNFDQAAALFAEHAALFQLLGDKRIAALSFNALGYVHRLNGNYATAQSMYGQSLAIYREVGDYWGQAETLWLMAQKAYFQGDSASACILGEESLAMSRTIGDLSTMSLVLQFLATVRLFQGEYATAQNLVEESMFLLCTLGDKHGISYAYGLSILGRLAFYRGDSAAASVALQESLEIFRELGCCQGIAHVLGFLGPLLLDCGDHSTARSLLEEGLTHARSIGDTWLITLCLDGLGRVVAAQGKPVWAARLWGRAESLRETITSHTQPVERFGYVSSVTAVRASLDEQSFSVAWAEGRTLTLAEIDTALTTSLCEKEYLTPSQAPGASTRQRASAQTYPDTLTPREAEVVNLLASGLTDAQIAEKLVVSPRTVHSHLRSIYSKFGVTSRSAAICYLSKYQS